MSCNSNCSSLGSHELVDCGEYTVGGISALGFLECNHQISDFTNATQIAAEITAGRLIVVKNIRGEVPEASPQEGESASACGPEQEVYNYDRSLTWTDQNVTANNIDFYNELKRRTYYLIAFACEDSQIYVIQQNAQFAVTQSVPKTKKDRRMFKGTAKWTEYDEPPLYSLGTTAANLFKP